MKRITGLFIILALTALFSGGAFAMDLGELVSINDRIIPDGETGVITQTVTAVTNVEGMVALPMYSKSEMTGITAVDGTLAGKPEEVSIADKEFYMVSFLEKEAEVSFVATIRKEGIYELDEADLGDTFPSNAHELVYKVSNTSPLDIGRYSAEVAIPKDLELLNIVSYSAKKPYGMFEADGYDFGSYNFKGIDNGEEIKLTLNVYKKSRAAVALIWIAAIVISALYMFKNRELLVKAKKARAEKLAVAKAGV